MNARHGHTTLRPSSPSRASARLYDGTPSEQTAAYARAVRYGAQIAVSGTVAMTRTGTVLHRRDPYRQTLAAFKKALKAVEELGGRREDVIRTRIFLQVGEDWKGPARAHQETFAGIDPANTSLYVAGFFVPDALVEVEIDALIESAAQKTPSRN